jgi:hypothetical protein
MQKYTLPKYFKIVERKGKTPWGAYCTYKLLQDATGVIWGVFYSIRLARMVAFMLAAKHEETLKQRGEINV